MCKNRNFLLLVLFFLCVAAHGQNTAQRTLSLDDMSAFKPQAGNWFIVGDVLMDPTIDTHVEHHAAPTPSEKPIKEKKGKKDKADVAIELPKAVTFQSGKGILLNINDANKKSNLITNWEHGDIELEFDVMLPKGSNSGIFLQGRYEIQLFDSWGVAVPKFTDIGGIYRNWETQQDKIYMGKPPLSNPAKAPGLWQKMKISFQAPRFDADGNKIANAKFIYVELNGIKIHDNVEVPKLTGAPIENNEKPLGPLMIQGDHGPVAIRNIKYTLIKNIPVSLSKLTYKTYLGHFKTIENFITEKPVASGIIPALTYEVVETDDAYAAIFNGTITVPEDNTYKFSMVYAGGGQLIINGKKLIDNQRVGRSNKDAAAIDLKAGTYPIEIYNYKDVAWVAPKLALFVNTPDSHTQSLHAYSSYPPDANMVSSIFIDPGSNVKLLRAFVDFKGDRNKRLTHTIGVGDPRNTHYIYDLKNGNLVGVWHGNFVDATPMWHDRGDGSFIPQGAVQFLFINQPLAFLNNSNDAFPAASQEHEFKAKGYEIDNLNGLPIFKYTYRDFAVEDSIYPDDDGKIITHKLAIKGSAPKQNLYYKMAEGENIVLMPNGLYVIDQQYYIKPTPAAKVEIRHSKDKKELVVAVDGDTITYSIIW